ncbi:MAG: filamentous hemagglutinin N-terminal domain-containing protein [Parachlamydiales bacterium]|nr:filamentous hemagglutinin N-terminal domain-containing protein [Parachlamydiales bacterium]
MRFAYIFLFAPCLLAANPSGHSVIHGEAHIALQGDHLSIRTSDKAIIEWQNFSINRGEITQFLQPSTASAVLNRVISSNPSELFGSLKSNGKVYLINPNGIVIGSSGVLQTGSFIGSTFDVMNQDFLKGGDLVFEGFSKSHLINEGKIEALDGDVVLVGQFVKNSGEISAPNGLSAIGCGAKVLLKAFGEERLFILTPVDTELDIEAGIQQQGMIESLSAELKASGNPYALAISHEGKIDALGVKKESGNIYLVAEKGNLHINGEVISEKGTVHLHADQIVLADDALIDVSSENGGGSVFAGKDPAFAQEPKAIFVKENARILADSLTEGDGGKIILWADEMNAFNGTISAKGGPQSGDGGFVEISSRNSFFPKGQIDTKAPFGKTGTLLLDPCAVTISAAATTLGVSPFGPPGPCPLPAQNYTFGALAAANINNTDLANYLSCNNVTVDASMSTAAVTGTITVTDPISWTPAAPTTLKLIANGTGGLITINNSIIANYNAASAITTIYLDAPTINVNASTMSTEVKTFSGDIEIYAPTALNLNATAGHVFINTIMTAGNGRNIIINPSPASAGNLTMSGSGMGNLCSISSDQNLSARFNNVDMSCSSGSFLGAAGATSNVVVDVAGFCHLIAGNTASGGSALGNNQGPTNLTVAGPIVMQGGSALNTYAKIEAAVVSGSGNLILQAGSISMTGGSGTNAHALIGTGDLTSFAPGGNGDVLVSCSGPISITSGTANQSFAGFATNGNLATNDISITYTIPNSMTITSNASGALMTAFAGIQTTVGGNITVTGMTDLTMTGFPTNGANPAKMQVGMMGGNLFVSSIGTATLNSNSGILNNSAAGQLIFSSGSLSMFGSTGDSLIVGNGPVAVNPSMNAQLIAGSNNARIRSNFDSTTFSTTGSLNLVAGSGVMAIAEINAAATPGSSGDLTVNAGNITLVGGTGMFALADLFVGQLGAGGNGEIFITTSGNLSLYGGSANTAAALIGTWGPGASNNITINAGGNLNMTATSSASSASPFILTGIGGGGGNINITTGNDIIMSAASLSSAATIQGSFMGSPLGGDMVIKAGRNLNVGAFSSIANNNANNTLTLVADNNFPSSVGPGNFFLDATGTLFTASGSNLFVYTSLSVPPNIQGLMNTQPLGVVTPLVNTPTAQWGIFYPNNPNGVTGTPFTIFYKTFPQIPPGSPAANNFTIAINEPFQDWNTFFDRGIYVAKTMQIEYKGREKLKDKTVSSYDLLSWEYIYFYLSHRNYNTLKLDHRL